MDSNRGHHIKQDKFHYPSIGEVDEFCANMPLEKQDEMLSRFLKDQFPDLDVAGASNMEKLESLCKFDDMETENSVFDVEKGESNFNIAAVDDSTPIVDEAELISMNPMLMHYSEDQEHSDVENVDVTINRDLIDKSVRKIMKQNDLTPPTMTDTDMDIVKTHEVTHSHESARKPSDRRSMLDQISKENSYATSPIIVSANNSVPNYEDRSPAAIMVEESPRSNFQIARKAMSAPGSILSANNSIRKREKRSPELESMSDFPCLNFQANKKSVSVPGSILKIDVSKPPPSRGDGSLKPQVGRHDPNIAEAVKIDEAAGNYEKPENEEDCLEAPEAITGKKEPEIFSPPLNGKMVWIWNNKMRTKMADDIKLAFDVNDEIGIDRVMKKTFEPGEPSDMVYVLKTFQEAPKVIFPLHQKKRKLRNKETKEEPPRKKLKGDNSSNEKPQKTRKLSQTSVGIEEPIAKKQKTNNHGAKPKNEIVSMSLRKLSQTSVGIEEPIAKKQMTNNHGAKPKNEIVSSSMSLPFQANPLIPDFETTSKGESKKGAGVYLSTENSRKGDFNDGSSFDMNCSEKTSKVGVRATGSTGNVELQSSYFPSSAAPIVGANASPPTEAPSVGTNSSPPTEAPKVGANSSPSPAAPPAAALPAAAPTIGANSPPTTVAPLVGANSFPPTATPSIGTSDLKRSVTEPPSTANPANPEVSPQIQIQKMTILLLKTIEKAKASEASRVKALKERDEAKNIAAEATFEANQANKEAELAKFEAHKAKKEAAEAREDTYKATFEMLKAKKEAAEAKEDTSKATVEAERSKQEAAQAKEYAARATFAAENVKRSTSQERDNSVKEQNEEMRRVIAILDHKFKAAKDQQRIAEKELAEAKLKLAEAHAKIAEVEAEAAQSKSEAAISKSKMAKIKSEAAMSTFKSEQLKSESMKPKYEHAQNKSSVTGYAEAKVRDNFKINANNPLRFPGSPNANNPLRFSGSSNANNPLRFPGSSNANNPLRFPGSSNANYPLRFPGSSNANNPLRFPGSSFRQLYIWNDRMKSSCLSAIRKKFKIGRTSPDRIMKKGASDESKAVYVLKVVHKNHVTMVRNQLLNATFKDGLLNVGLYTGKYPYQTPDITFFGRDDSEADPTNNNND